MGCDVQPETGSVWNAGRGVLCDHFQSGEGVKLRAPSKSNAQHEG